MKWICIKGTHVNTTRVDSFYWKEGHLCVWFAGQQVVTTWEDPDRELYIKMCHALGVRPYEEVDEDGKN